MASVSVFVCPDKKNYKLTVNVQGGDEVDRAFAVSMYLLYLLSSPFGLPKKTFSEFLTDKLGGTRFNVWARKHPKIRQYVKFVEQVARGVEFIDSINVGVCNGVNECEKCNNCTESESEGYLPKAISTRLIPPIDLVQVVLAYVVAKIDEAYKVQFLSWVKNLVERAKLELIAQGVDLTVCGEPGEEK